MADPLFAIKPAKPVSQMTDAERAEFANALFDGLAARKRVAENIEPETDE